MLRAAIYKAKWRIHHPSAFERYEEICANEQKSPEELSAALFTTKNSAGSRNRQRS